MDRRNEEDANRMATANFLKKCRPQYVGSDEANLPTIQTGGHRGGTGYAHNKVVFINPSNRKGEVKIGFSSGNMSSGTVTHHENWHFVTTNIESYFAQAHLCLMNGVLKFGDSKATYSNYIAKCRNKIETEEESDIKTFFIPGNGKQAFKAIEGQMRKSKEVQMAAHRFSYTKLVSLLSKTLVNTRTKVKLVVDDDLYWTGVYKRGMGRNSLLEYGKIRGLEKKGMQVKYIETYADNIFEPKSMQLQHNKFLIFSHKSGGGSVFTGAGNLTGAAFTTNFENFYLISIPSVYRAFRKQYTNFWQNLADSWNEMPVELKLP
ncbi:MAG: hypothetical protein HOM21_07870 [Halobacteriovoraceae bacterium]|nr:hypothetical protein [Halobacteriovoraceae bacterium]